MTSLESKAEEIFDYNLSDVFIPLKHLRHIPKIIRERDIVTRAFGVGYLAAITLAQLSLGYTILFYNS